MKLSKDRQIQKNFTFNEFLYSEDKETPTLEFAFNIMDLSEKLQALRDKVGPITINSAFRGKTHNKQVNGTPNSYHTQGLAADIKFEFKNWTRESLETLFNEIGFKNVNFYWNSDRTSWVWIHVDVGNTWNGKEFYYRDMDANTQKEIEMSKKEYTVINGKTIIPIHSLNKQTCASFLNCISGTFQYKNVTSSMLCIWGKWKRLSSTHDWLKQPETVIYTTKNGEVKSQRCLYSSEIKDEVVHAIGGLGLHNYNPNLEGFVGVYADVLRDTYHTAIGHNGKDWIGVYAKGTGKQIRDIMMNDLKCNFAIMLDGGSIAAINTDTKKANLNQVQNNMIQFIRG